MPLIQKKHRQSLIILLQHNKHEVINLTKVLSIITLKFVIIITLNGICLAKPIADGENGYSPTAMAANGDNIVLGYFDGKIRLFDPAQSKTIKIIDAHSKPVECLGADVLGRYIISSSTDGKVVLWNAKTGEEIFKTFKSGSILKTCAIDLGGKYVIAGGGSNIYVWDASSWENVALWENIKDGIYSAAIHYNGRIVAIGGKEGKINLYSLPDGKLIKTLGNGKGVTMSLAFAPKTDILLAGNSDKTVTLWNITKGKIEKSHSLHNDSVTAVAISSEGKYAITGDDNGNIFFWDISKNKTQQYLKDGISVRTAIIDPNARFFAAGIGKPYEKNKYVRVWYPAHPTQIRDIFTFYGSQAVISSIGYVSGYGAYGEHLQIESGGKLYPFAEKGSIYNNSERLKLNLGKGLE